VEKRKEQTNQQSSFIHRNQTRSPPSDFTKANSTNINCTGTQRQTTNNRTRQTRRKKKNLKNVSHIFFFFIFVKYFCTRFSSNILFACLFSLVLFQLVSLKNTKSKNGIRTRAGRKKATKLSKPHDEFSLQEA
jgi:hypothetical protein